VTAAPQLGNVRSRDEASVSIRQPAWRNLLRAFTIAGSLASAGIALHTIANLRHLRTIEPQPATITERVSVLLPVRNEARRVQPTLQSLLAQRGLTDVEFLILDDGSTDDTAAVVAAAVGSDARVRVIHGGDSPLPEGWLGKPWACHRLAQHADGSVLVFLDADVVLAPTAIASTIQTLRCNGLALISPYPRQLAQSLVERITQPIVVWSWIALLPLRAVETKPYPSLAAANGQFLCIDARAYAISGGHSSVAGFVVEDVEMLRSLKRHGFTGAPANGALIAECRMYDGARDVYTGYTKSLWTAFGSPTGAAATMGVLATTYILPAIAAVWSRDATVRAWGAGGYAMGVLSRDLVARRTGEHRWPDALTQPISIATLVFLTVESFRLRRLGRLSWRGRRIA
jgi:hypothetical protein